MEVVRPVKCVSVVPATQMGKVERLCCPNTMLAGMYFFYLPKCCSLSEDIQHSCWQSPLMACRRDIRWYIFCLSSITIDWLWSLGSLTITVKIMTTTLTIACINNSMLLQHHTRNLLRYRTDIFRRGIFIKLTIRDWWQPPLFSLFYSQKYF